MGTDILKTLGHVLLKKYVPKKNKEYLDYIKDIFIVLENRIRDVGSSLNIEKTQLVDLCTELIKISGHRKDIDMLLLLSAFYIKRYVYNSDGVQRDELTDITVFQLYYTCSLCHYALDDMICPNNR